METPEGTSQPFAHMPPSLLSDPAADEWTQPFWDAASREQLVAPRCNKCGRFRMPPGRFCPHCLSQDVEFVPLEGTGTVFTFIVVRTSPDLDPDHAPFVPAAIDADGAPGMRFVSNIVDCEPSSVTIGMAVRVVWHHVNDSLTLPLWAPA
jgi:uncharacterized OB-fold protein